MRFSFHYTIIYGRVKNNQRSESKMPYVTVKMLEGRSEEQKKALVEKVTAAVSETTGAPEEKIVVFIEEMTKGHYAVGGKRLSDQ
ncbi:4-oxalocrotonate tautomerase [Sutcliffiella horikoshii]